MMNMPVVLHHADHMASVIEYERWKTGNNNSPKKAVVKKVIGKKVTTSSSDATDIFKGLFE